MIWFKRILLVILILAFIVTFAAMIHSSWVAWASGNPGFYNDQLVKADVYNWVYDDLMPAALDEAEERLAEESAGDALTDLPVPVGLVKKGLVAVTETVLPPDRLQTITEAVIAAVVPYLVGDKDTFLTEVRLHEIIDAWAEGEIQEASGEEIFEYLADEIIGSVILANLEQVSLPSGIVITREELSSAVAEALGDVWGGETLAEIINGLAAYLKGETETLDINITVDLTADEAPALTALVGLFDRKLEEYFNALPVGTQQEFEDDVENLGPGSLPDSRPPDMDYQEFKAALGIDFAASFQQWVGDRIPASWTYTADQFRQALGPSITEFLEDTRNFIAEIADMSEEDLKRYVAGKLGTDVEALEKARQGVERAIDTREEVEIFRTWSWYFWAVPALLLIGIVLLAGRTWRGRLVWALAVLFVSGLVIFVAALAYQAFLIDDHAQRLVGDPAAQEGVKAVLIEKGNEVAYVTLSSLAAGVRSTAIYIMLGSGVSLLAIGGWALWQSGQRPRAGD